MKEGVSGYFDLLSDKSGVTLRFHYKETYDIETAKSNLSIVKIQLKSASWMTTYWLDGTITVEGQEIYNTDSHVGEHGAYVEVLDTFYDITDGETEQVVTDFGTATDILHNDDGTKTVTITVALTGYTQSGNAGSGWIVSDNVQIDLTQIQRGLIYIDNGSGFDAYCIYIDNGSSWDLYSAYIDNGDSWDFYG